MTGDGRAWALSLPPKLAAILADRLSTDSGWSDWFGWRPGRAFRSEALIELNKIKVGLDAID